MLNTKQIVVIVLILVLMGALLARPITGLVNEEKAESAANAAETTSVYNLTNVSDIAKQGLNPAIAEEIATLENKISAAEGEEKVTLLQQLADKWDDVAKYAPQGFIYQEMAAIDPQFDYWLKSGNAYRKAYSNIQDTIMVRELNQLAIGAYEKAVALDENNLDAKLGLGAAMVSGTNNPMAGIAMIQEVIAVEPKNVEANRTLGLFSLQSKQFDRAIQRFLTVIESKPDAESYFYLATAYQNIGLKSEAIDAFQKSKSLASDPTLSQYIDSQIKELSK